MTYIDEQDAMRLILDEYRAERALGWTRDRRQAFYGFCRAIWLCVATGDFWMRLRTMIEGLIDAAYTVRDEA